MKITRILAYRVELPLHETTYKWSGGKSVTVFDSTIVARRDRRGPRRPRRSLSARAVLSAGVCGGRARRACANSGRICSAKIRAQLAKLNRRMDAALKGHPYVKSGIDIACWDILGQATGMPVCELLGGRYGEDVQLYRAISQESPEEMAAKVAGYRAEGYRRFQLKVGGDPDVDIARIRAVAAKLQPGDRLVADANTGWVQHEAVRVVEGRARRGCLHRAAVPDLRGMPRACAGSADHPFVLDENIDGLDMLLRAKADLAMDVVNLKISKLGGLTKIKQARDLCVSMGIAMTLEDSLGRRHRHRRHRASRAQHADGVPVHDAPTSTATSPCQHRRRRAAARERPHGRLDGARPRHHAEDGRARKARRRRLVGSILEQTGASAMLRFGSSGSEGRQVTAIGTRRSPADRPPDRARRRNARHRRAWRARGIEEIPGVAVSRAASPPCRRTAP